ncbi:MAG TPA: LLM class flavin-dependent oxidoreductase [Chloroflexia bacterium]|nr:LLM class flavin-dependent oxidoreductase [Chloroflexia bacterium]
MPAQDITFGFVTQATPRGLPPEIMADPTRAAYVTMDRTGELIEMARPYFDTVWAEDHFQWGDRAVFEAITTLAFLAGKHEGLRYGHIVLGQSYRNPALTAKLAANMQVLTKGNFILGIGAGWKEDEYRAYGYPYPPASQRIDELEEAVQICRAMWADSPASFEGKYYRIEDALSIPLPNPPIPLLIAGGGEKKTLRVAAKYADWWNAPFMEADKFAHKQEVLARHCRDIGRDPAEILHSYYAITSLSEDPEKVQRNEDPHFVAGSPDDVTRELEQFVRLGVKHIQVRFTDFPSSDGLELFINKVLPRLRG